MENNIENKITITNFNSIKITIENLSEIQRKNIDLITESTIFLLKNINSKQFYEQIENMRDADKIFEKYIETIEETIKEIKRNEGYYI